MKIVSILRKTPVECYQSRRRGIGSALAVHEIRSHDHHCSRHAPCEHSSRGNCSRADPSSFARRAEDDTTQTRADARGMRVELPSRLTAELFAETPAVAAFAVCAARSAGFVLSTVPA